MLIKHNNLPINFNYIPISNYWNNSSEGELLMHKIHAYPAKFPFFIIQKALEYAKKNKINVKSIGDIFCGCGTTALEAKKNHLDFWGCDINPVATLIAKVKSEYYTEKLLNYYYNRIIKQYYSINLKVPESYFKNKRITYWFQNEEINDLYRLLYFIKKEIPTGKYRNFFLCAFSNILKPTSRWLTKSIKPQVDPIKKIPKVKDVFEIQYYFMLKAAIEIKERIKSETKTHIVTKNFLKIKIAKPIADMIITSPPYVTSYDYADIHQLSSIWLGFTEDYRTLRDGTIGSVYNIKFHENDIQNLNYIGQEIYFRMLKANTPKAKTRSRSIAKYFLDLKKSLDKLYLILNDGGLAVFVIGNTKYCNVIIDNVKYLTKCMLDRNFKHIDVYKRIVRSKILTPYRDKNGRFSSDKRNRKIYGHEYIIIGKK